MKNRRNVLGLLIVALCILMTSCFDNKNQEGNVDENSSKDEISLPYEDAFVVDMMADENHLLISTMDVADDFSNSTAKVWETKDEGETWKQLFEKKFDSDSPGEIYVNAEMHFVGQGGILQVLQWPKDNPKEDYCHTYYMESLDDQTTEEFSKSDELKNLIDPYYVDPGLIYGWDLMNWTLIKADITKGTVESKKLDDVEQILNVAFDDTFAHIIYLSSKNEYAGFKYDLRNGKVIDAPLLDKMAKEIGKEQYDMVAGVRFYPYLKEGRKAYRYICPKGIFEFDDSGKNEIGTTASWGTNENTQFNKVAAVGDGEVWVYYSYTTGTVEHSGIKRIVLGES